MMDLNEYQLWALKSDRGNKANPVEMEVCCAMGLAGETGEYVDLVKKKVFHSKPVEQNALLLELGDILWYLAVAAHYHGFSLEEVAKGNQTKLNIRYPNGFSPEASLSRKDES